MKTLKIQGLQGNHFLFDRIIGTLTIFFLSLFLTFLSGCSKDTDEPILDENYESSLSIKSNELTVKEGDTIYIDLSLTEKLSKDLSLNLKINTDTIVNYINPEDYEPKFGYSVDNGKSWKAGIGSSVVFPSGSNKLKIRFKTIDDSLLEVHEEFHLAIEPDSESGIHLSNAPLESIFIRVEDNEANGVFTDDRETYPPMTFKADENYDNFTLFNMSRKARSRIEKYCLDQVVKDGFIKELFQDVKKICGPGPIRVKEFGINFNPKELGAYVFRSTSTKKDDGWTMVLNLLTLYYDFSSEIDSNGNSVLVKLPEPGYYGNEVFTIVHEYGHIMTLDKTPETNSYFVNFHNLFYDASNQGMTLAKPKSSIKKPQFVTAYAESWILEDIAESFAYYIAQETIPTPNETSSGALQKIAFFKQYPVMEKLKVNIREKIIISTPTGSDIAQ